jgi:hypothetical protein
MRYNKTTFILILFFLFLFLTRGEGFSKSEQDRHIGTVLEVLHAGKYIYLRIREDDSEKWIATYSGIIGEVSPGNKIQYYGGFEMKNFESKSLGRKFKSVLFVSMISRFGGKIKNFTDIPSDEYHKNITKRIKDITPPKKGEIKKPENGLYIEEIYTKLEEINNKKIIVRGKVIKVNRRILGKNWITIQDGTGESPDNALTIVSKEDTEVGKIITVKGVVKRDVNLGAGYKYKVLLEDAEILK